VSIRVADDGWYDVDVVVLTERRVDGWPALLLRLFGGDDGTHWGPAQREAGLEALLLRQLKKAGLGDTVRLRSCDPPAAVPQAGTTTRSMPRK
jgi:hypothetical protein